MLSYIQISGLALIDELSIDFAPGLNVITGETGAGKSILIKALSFVLGGKVTTSIIRKGHNHACVTASFAVHSKHSALSFLHNVGIDLEFEEEIIIRRKLSSKNRSQFWLNDQVISMSSVRKLSQHLIDILGQHENQGLLNESKHVDYLDQAHPVIRERITRKYQKVTFDYNKILTQVTDFAAKLRDLDYLQFRIEEITSLNPSAEDFHEIECSIKEATISSKVVSEIDKAKGLVDHNVSSLSFLCKELTRSLLIIDEALDSAEVGPILDVANNTCVQIDEISYGLERLASKFEIEHDLESLENRISNYYELFRKLSVNDVEGLLQKLREFQDDVSFVESAVDELTLLIQSLHKSVSELKRDCRKLTSLRRSNASKICASIEQELSELNMSGARIQFEFNESTRSLSCEKITGLSDQINEQWSESISIMSEMSAKGMEQAKFMLASNPGEPFMPLTKVASGGEISRILLGFKKVLSDSTETCVMVFDEIDAGISGKTANVVGLKLKELASRYQIICVSHLAQIAAFADKHFLVSKFSEKGRTKSQLVELSENESLHEIARLLSGNEVSKASLENAKNLVDRAR